MKDKMKLTAVLVLFVLMGFMEGELLPEDRNIRLLGEWGTGPYVQTVVKGTVAYCAADNAGLDLINVGNPTNPGKLGNFDAEDSVQDVFVRGNYAYLAGYWRGLHVVDVSNPARPKLMGNIAARSASSVSVSGNYAFIVCSGYNEKLMIIDVANPGAPSMVSEYQPSVQIGESFKLKDATVNGNHVFLLVDFWTSGSVLYSEIHVLDIGNPSAPILVETYKKYSQSMSSIFLKDNRAYVGMSQGLVVIDISNPVSLEQIGSLSITGISQVFAEGNFAYLSIQTLGLVVVDINAIPPGPVEVGRYTLKGESLGVWANPGKAFIANRNNGLQILDISNPSTPNLLGSYNYSFNPTDVKLKGNYAYISDSALGLRILDISDPSAPHQVGTWEHGGPFNEWNRLAKVELQNNFAYYFDSTHGFNVIDITNPSRPIRVGFYATPIDLMGGKVLNNYAYLLCEGSFIILDVSQSSAPKLKGYCLLDYHSYGGKVSISSNNYAFVTTVDGVGVIDISDPAAPDTVDVGISNCSAVHFARGNYLYFSDCYQSDGCYLADVSNPAKIEGLKRFWPVEASCMVGYNDYMCMDSNLYGLVLFNLSNPTTPRVSGYYSAGGNATDMDGDRISVLRSGKLEILSYQPSAIPSAAFTLNRTHINVSAYLGAALPQQTFTITREGAQPLNWMVARENFPAYGIDISPTYGTGSGTITVSFDKSYFSVGTYTDTIIVSDIFGGAEPRAIPLTVSIYTPGSTSAPFGVFDTPIDKSIVSGSIPVTGWALDDFGIQSVTIYRDGPDANSLIYIGEAVLVEGARPDVAQAYPRYPYNEKAGWGYMMLTYGLPGGGNGTCRIHAIAADFEGNQTTLGSKTIICDNASAVKPFGTIETPEQGGIASGKDYVNFGWVLTPQPNTIPFDGTTINVWVDGINLGNPVYNKYREDIATLFPGYNNTNGPLGYFHLDTTAYENGVHTIQWAVTDTGGNSDGIGSRYFSIRNQDQRTMKTTSKRNITGIPIDDFNPVSFESGYNLFVEPQTLYPDRDGNIFIRIKELERLEIHLPNFEGSTWDIINPLIGSTMDAKNGIFYWTPGPGFIGTYRLVFINTDIYGRETRKDIMVIIDPKF